MCRQSARTSEILQRTLLDLKSVIVCLEDAIYERDIPKALTNLTSALDKSLPPGLLCFVRPRDGKLLREGFRGLRRISGLSTASCCPRSTSTTRVLCGKPPVGIPRSWLLPTPETDIAFAPGRLATLCERLREADNPVLCVRTGGNDLLRLPGLHRPRKATLYETVAQRVGAADYGIQNPPAEMAAQCSAGLRQFSCTGPRSGNRSTTASQGAKPLSPTQVPVIERPIR
ncbi:MAG: HpcH/HpaI aldolase/citrate lyase family protein [Candidatus Competibacteraceae bacterium]